MRDKRTRMRKRSRQTTLHASARDKRIKMTTSMNLSLSPLNSRVVYLNLLSLNFSTIINQVSNKSSRKSAHAHKSLKHRQLIWLGERPLLGGSAKTKR